MHSFRNDYSEGCHPTILNALTACNTQQSVGYTEDAHCANARDLIRKAMLDAVAASEGDHDFNQRTIARVESSHIEFVCGGTAANLLVISSMLRPNECVIAAKDGHINVHETGAIEATGHKVLTTPDIDGILTVEGVDAVMKEHCYGNDYHMVSPRVLYLSFATEMGMVHSSDQLRALREYADDHGLLIYIDGARLASGLASEGSDAELSDIIGCADAFTFGGTKNGAMMGEAVVLLNPEASGCFKALMKQRGSLLAKGFLLGIQFETLFSVKGADAGVDEAVGDEALYMSLGRHSNEMARRLRECLVENGLADLASDAKTNQVFVNVPNNIADALIESFGCEAFGVPDDSTTTVRFVCSWATTKAHIIEFDLALKDILKDIH